MSDINHEWTQDYDGEIVLDRERQKQQVEPPKKYNVFIFNDDYSTWEFVVEVLTTIFGQTEDQANRTTKDVHTKGKGLAGTYSKDIAETKAMIMNDFAQANGMPLHAEPEVSE